MKIDLLKKTLLAVSVAAAFGLAGCSADGSGTESGSIVSDGGAPLVPPLNNDGTTPTNVTDGGDPDGSGPGTKGPTISGNFICTQGARAFGDATTEVIANGLVGGPLSTLLNTLGGAPVTTLLNSVTEKDNVIDGRLGTFASVTLPVSLLGVAPLVDSVGEAVLFPTAVPSGNYAVFGITFPAATLALNLTRTVQVTTFLGDAQQETVSIQEPQLQLLSLNLAGDEAGFVGFKAHKKYDAAAISITALVVGADVGKAMRIHELCTDGRFK